MNVSATPEVVVIIVNYNTPELARSAVESVLAREHGGRRVAVHLVDNFANRESRETLKQYQWDDSVTVWLEDENLGFGKGNNVVLKYLSKQSHKPKYIFFLNPDATLHNEAIGITADFLDRNASVGAVGAAILRPDGSKVTAAFRFPNARNELDIAVGVGVVSKLVKGYRVAMPPDTGSCDVDWVTGAGFLCRFDLVEKIGFFDTDFFLYFEETEFMWRLHKAGSRVVYLPEARITHEAGAATGYKDGKLKEKKSSMPFYLYDSWRLYFVKTRGVGYARKVALIKFVFSYLGAFLKIIRRRENNLPGNFFKDYCRFVLRPLFIGDALEERGDGVLR